MKFKKILLSLTLVTFTSCAGLKSHKPKLDSTIEIAKADGMYRIVSIKGESSSMNSILNRDFMNCNSTTFAMPRGNTVVSFIREIFENELTVAKKFSMDGEDVSVIVKTINLKTEKNDRGTWTIVMDYIENDKTKNIETVTSFESKLSLLSACVNTSNIFEEALADNFVEYFKRKNRKIPESVLK